LRSWEYKRGYFPKQISSVSISRYSFITDALWGIPDGGTIPRFTPEQLQRRIEDKNLLVPIYRQKANEVWLLIVYGFTVSSWYQRTDEVLSEKYSSQFDQIFLFDIFRQNVDRLSVA